VSNEIQPQAPDGSGPSKLRVIAIVVIVLLVGLVALALFAEQSSSLPFDYEGF
jgi:hypothetical protein